MSTSILKKTVFLASVGVCLILPVDKSSALTWSALMPTVMSSSPYDHFVPAATDQDLSGPQIFIKGMADQALQFLTNADMPIEKKQTAFEELLDKSFDMRTISRFSLGRYWRVASDVQREEYMSLFRDMVIRVYSERFHDYKGQSFEVRGARSEGVKDTIVTSFIVPSSGSKIQVDWRVRAKDDGYKIVDVIVEGVSMSLTQRSDFAAVIQRGGGNVEALLDHLRSRT